MRVCAEREPFHIRISITNKVAFEYFPVTMRAQPPRRPVALISYPPPISIIIIVDARALPASSRAHTSQTYYTDCITIGERRARAETGREGWCVFGRPCAETYYANTERHAPGDGRGRAEGVSGRRGVVVATTQQD